MNASAARGGTMMLRGTTAGDGCITGSGGGSRKVRGNAYLMILSALAASVALFNLAFFHSHVAPFLPRGAPSPPTREKNRQSSSIWQRRQQRSNVTDGDDENASRVGGRSGTATTPVATIGLAISITGCGGGDVTAAATLLDGAAVLLRSVRVNSHPVHSASRYSFRAYAFVHPTSSDDCPPTLVPHLADLGYEVLIKDTPVNVTEIRGEFLRRTIVSRGCCGERELIKLHSYGLTDHPAVVHMDVDSIVLNPLDELFDAMLAQPPSLDRIGIGDDGGPATEHVVPVMVRNRSAAAAAATTTAMPPPAGGRIGALFTRDYTMIQPSRWVDRKTGLRLGDDLLPGVPVQGGFLVVRPDPSVLDEYRRIILEGRFFPGSGWGGMGYGGFYGAQQIQGLVAYYYDYHVKHRAADGETTEEAAATDTADAAVELDPCLYNNMAQSHRARAEGNETVGKCRTGQPEDECRDCRRLAEAEEHAVRAFHFTICPKPWKCRYLEGGDDGQEGMCVRMQRRWFQYRRDLEESLVVEEMGGGRGVGEDRQGEEGVGDGKDDEWIRLPDGTYRPEHFLGACGGPGAKGYIPIRMPVRGHPETPPPRRPDP